MFSVPSSFWYKFLLHPFTSVIHGFVLKDSDVGNIILRLCDSSSSVYLQNGSTQENDADSSGLVRVTLVEARDLIAADLRGTSDPFVNLQYGDEKRTTKVEELADEMFGLYKLSRELR